MKNIVLQFFLLIYCNYTFGQKPDSNYFLKVNTSKYNFNEYGVELKINKRYKKIFNCRKNSSR